MDRRLESMDALRAFAIITVVVAHSVLAYGATPILAPLQFGGTGVDLFFVLSGWLLGNQLFKEQNSAGSVDVMRFWYRRWMRTLPAYYTILLLSVCQRYYNNPSAIFPYEYFIFIQNYHTPLEFFTISWSLALEEQFYLVIAPFVALIMKQQERLGVFLLLSALVAPAVFRMQGLYSSEYEGHVRIDGCILGVLMAYVRQNTPELWSRLLSIAPLAGLIAATIYLIYLIGRWNPGWGIGDPDKLFLVFLFGAWVAAANHPNYVSRIRFPGAYYIATRSYAMYLVHPEALALMKRVNEGIPFVLFLLGTVLITSAVAEGLHRIIEKPFMKIRDR